MFTSQHIRWVLFFPLRKRTFEPIPANKWPITNAMLHNLKQLLQTPAVCLVLQIHSLHTHISSPPLPQRGAVVVIFVCFFSASLSLLFNFSVQRSTSLRLREMALLAFWGEAQTLSAKRWQAWSKGTREDDRGREGVRQKMEREERKDEVWDTESGVCGVLKFCRCHSHRPASGQQSQLPDTWNIYTNTLAHTHSSWHSTDSSVENNNDWFVFVTSQSKMKRVSCRFHYY